MADKKSTGNSGIKRRDILLGGAVLAGGYGVYYAGRRYLVPRPGSQLTPISQQVPTRIYGDDAYPVYYRRPLPLDSPPARYPGFNPSVKLLKKGTVRRKGAMPLPCDIVFERDVPVKLRDGVTIYTDVFRPALEGQYPAVVAWSPYGKEIGGQWFDDVPHRSNVPLKNVSELQKFEAPDPAVFIERGYVVLNPDARGAYSSEGNINFWGRQVAEDGYDFIEWAAVQDWSSGKVAMAGNSWLAVSQWFIAAEKPPHLAAIAPWEGASAKFHPGGIPMLAFDEIVIQSFAGKNLVEDLPKMSVTHPLLDPYWQDKAARLELIDVPAYVVASYTNMAHTFGTFDGFRRISSAQKWLRVHNTQEWQDFNDPVQRQDLLRFFDHVLKGVANGWETTPRVRLAVLNPGGEDVLNRPESEWPLQRQIFKQLFLTADNMLSTHAVAEEGVVRYKSTGGDTAKFIFNFDRDTEITGYMKLRVWLQTDGADDMDVMVVVEKLDGQGKSFASPPGAPPGSKITASAMLRVSLREVDAARSSESEPYQTFRNEARLKPGEIVPVDIGIWPMALLYRAGEQLSLTLSGLGDEFKFPFDFGSAEIPVPRDGGTFVPDADPEVIVLGGPAYTKPPYTKQQAIANPPSRNSGNHLIHMGGRYDSYLLIPVIPSATPSA